MRIKAFKKWVLILAIVIALERAPLRAQTASGTDSFAVGSNTIASGSYSVAAGYYATASGAASSAFGWYSSAGGFSSAAFGSAVAGGPDSFANGLYSTAYGYCSTASGYYTSALDFGGASFGAWSTATATASAAFGENTAAYGTCASAFGFATTASGLFSVAIGAATLASGRASTAFGEYSTASGSYSTASGYYTIAASLDSVAVGSGNVGGGSANTWVGTDPLFEVGNGTYNPDTESLNRSDALVVYKNGNTTITGTDNELPNQTLVGSHSILTEALADARYLTSTSAYGIFLTSTGAAASYLPVNPVSLNVTGTATASTFDGSGAELTSLPAAQISGTLPSSVNGANLTGVLHGTGGESPTFAALTTTGNGTIGGTTRLEGSVIVTGTLVGSTVVAAGTNAMLVPQQGDLSMGGFTAGPTPQ